MKDAIAIAICKILMNDASDTNDVQANISEI
jgi:hypothetical protein